MNTHVRDNLNVLRSGGIAIASQAAGDIPYAVDGTSLGRTANLKWNIGGNSLDLAAGMNISGSFVKTVGGSRYVGVASKTANYTTTGTDEQIDCTSGTFTITIHTAVGFKDQVLTITNNGSGAITINTTSGQTVSGIASGVLVLAQYQSITIKSDNANWFIQ